MTFPTHPQPATSPSTEAVAFPRDFLFGAATAAFQIEGATDVDGRSDSIWDTFCRVPGAVVGGDDGTVAADHYRRYRDDVALMKQLSLDSYRFSVAWPRVRPDGGKVDKRGLDFYSRLVDELLDAGIKPWLTLYHWDLPQALEDRGGWANRDTAYRFVDYALSVHDALGDRVPVWTTLNEPWCSAFLGYAGGQHAPGRRDPVAAMRAAHHLLLAHGLALTELRRRDPALSLGISLNLTHPEPADPADQQDRDAARRIDGMHNRIFLDPLLEGRYPDDVLADTEMLGWYDDAVRDGDLEIISAPIDVLGVNYYHGSAVSAHPREDVVGVGQVYPDRPTGSPFVSAEHVTFPSRHLPVTDMGWEVQPWGLRDLLLRLHEDYRLPRVAVTENGAAYRDHLTTEGTVEDQERIAYLSSHLRAVREAMDAGVDVCGYFVWSLLDNFEWAFGYGKRFGLVYVDYATQDRIPKASAAWYATVASTRRLEGTA
ncbi:MAG: GH1 family beta-glucosidase [Nocardioidaceae bacterium]